MCDVTLWTAACMQCIQYHRTLQIERNGGVEALGPLQARHGQACWAVFGVLRLPKPAPLAPPRIFVAGGRRHWRRRTCAAPPVSGSEVPAHTQGKILSCLFSSALFLPTT